MRTNYFKTGLLAMMALAAFSCKKDDDNDVAPVTDEFTIDTVSAASGSTKALVSIQGVVNKDITFSSDVIYLLKGNVYVQKGSKLTIQPGTLIKGDKETKGGLIISRGATIDAQGTAANPIVFTSNQPKADRDRGDWAGVVILGNAISNNPDNATGTTIEGISSATSDNGLYGGANDADNSGIFKYVRIEFAGIALSQDNELNSLTMGSVGSGTEIHHIMISYAGDDAFEWFGGTVNHTHLVTLSTLDDDFDTDKGYTGKVQWGYVVREAGKADISGARAMEASSNKEVVTPVSSPVFANITAIGPRYFQASGYDANHKHAVRANESSAIKVYNSVFIGFVDGFENATASGTFEKNLLINSVAGKYLKNVALGDNDTTKSYSDVYSSDITLNGGAAPLLTSTSVLSPKTGISGITDASYVGAFGTSVDASWNWTSGWMNWDPKNTDY